MTSGCPTSSRSGREDRSSLRHGWVARLFCVVLVATACSGSDGADGEGAASTTATPATATSTTAEPDGSDTPPPDLGPELVVNGGFEAGTPGVEGWELSVGVDDQTASVVQEGSRNRYLTLSGTLLDDITWPQAVNRQYFTVEVGGSYRLSLRARSDGVGLFIPVVAFADESGTDVTAISPGTWEVGTPDWTDYEFVFEVPESVDHAYVIVRLALNTAMTSAPQLTVDVDDVSVRSIGP
jgi:hypothetical protein